MGHNLLFALRCFLPLFLGGMIALNSCKEERASINDDPGQGDDGGDEYEYVDDRYDNGISCEEYLTNYRGIPFKKDSEGNIRFPINMQDFIIYACMCTSVTNSFTLENICILMKKWMYVRVVKNSLIM